MDWWWVAQITHWPSCLRPLVDESSFPALHCNCGQYPFGRKHLAGPTKSLIGSTNTIPGCRQRVKIFTLFWPHVPMEKSLCSRTEVCNSTMETFLCGFLGEKCWSNIPVNWGLASNSFFVCFCLVICNLSSYILIDSQTSGLVYDRTNAQLLKILVVLWLLLILTQVA